MCIDREVGAPAATRMMRHAVKAAAAAVATTTNDFAAMAHRRRDAGDCILCAMANMNCDKRHPCTRCVKIGRRDACQTSSSPAVADVRQC